jgi:hypothetical protein
VLLDRIVAFLNKKFVSESFLKKSDLENAQLFSLQKRFLPIRSQTLSRSRMAEPKDLRAAVR